MGKAQRQESAVSPCSARAGAIRGRGFGTYGSGLIGHRAEGSGLSP